MAAMAVFSSHLIVINHKGEISSNLEKILCTTFFAKIHLSNHSFKPFIMFVLRDQIDRSESSINGQVSKLKEGLIKESRFVGTSLDDVLNLDPKHSTLLSNAFSEDYCHKLNIKIKWRNKIFPDEVLELRKKLIQQIDLVNEENVIKNLTDLYTNLCYNWETISKTGENIFKCKDLEEIKIRDEISAKSINLLTRHRTALAKILDDLINDIINSYKEKEIFDNSIETKCKHDIERCVEERKERVYQEFDSLTNVPYFPKSIVDEYGKKISYQFEYLKDISIQRLNENCIYLKNMSDYKNVNQKIIGEINDLLAKNIHYDNIDAFIRDIEKKFEKIDQENNNRLNSMNRSVDIENIERIFYDISRLILSQNRRKKKYYESVDHFFNEKKSIIGTNISDFQIFIIGFKQSIANFKNELNKKLDDFNGKLEMRCKSEIIDYIDNYIGCNSKCPCCGSKCQNAKGHQGNHRSQFHILDGFFKWMNNDTKQILTNFCWEKFINSKFYICDEEYKKYKNCKEFLLNEHPEWLFDIQENYDVYGKNASNSGNIRFRSQIMRAWMNTRKPLLKEYFINYKIVDKKYDNEWLSLEDEENMLPEDHVPKWNENI
ncbi:hypothetical protein BpHYR1_033599 [Brachionus plicatilis]|uniref:Interferon-induced very large GTPase 1-like n=1 Tax=Brachionus plicatilis TaxID=10195 RepID=A0A3M7SYU5_BRAPC|nr:hypothetical protein BpHYR1_033599 [Brachionus plicatilis]